MRWARRVAATVPASAAQPELVTAAGPESAAVRRTGLPERRTPPAQWPTQDNKKARVTNSVLEASQLSPLATGLHHGLVPPDPLLPGHVNGTA
jgi:hypothetical protein